MTKTTRKVVLKASLAQQLSNENWIIEAKETMQRRLDLLFVRQGFATYLLDLRGSRGSSCKLPRHDAAISKLS